ncbi:hypothetical protein E3E12_07435 [Formicincola oecophyllae]|uniref:Uncharacterized protein n=1 Tax=Formicincola oecophyllae TaxID=2558361 RepID=A0A4Y6UBU5_9PROT|nr:hypothetical protein [Formicincola oecophyllae]QDH14038.1 hypothetical protein E3E12_07435 [Formicincola oecophyllae]
MPNQTPTTPEGAPSQAPLKEAPTAQERDGGAQPPVLSYAPEAGFVFRCQPSSPAQAEAEQAGLTWNASQGVWSTQDPLKAVQLITYATPPLLDAMTVLFWDVLQDIDAVRRARGLKTAMPAGEAGGGPQGAPAGSN